MLALDSLGRGYVALSNSVCAFLSTVSKYFLFVQLGYPEQCVRLGDRSALQLINYLLMLKLLLFLFCL